MAEETLQGYELRVWAPASESVTVVSAPAQRVAATGALDPERGGTTPAPDMSNAATVEEVVARRERGGWWRAELRHDPREVPYAFRVNGGEPLPDPRSERQLWGVHGPSLRVDHEAFSWTDAGFQQRPSASSLIYEAHVGTFSPEGDFDGVARRLDHLVELGVTHLELMPVATFAGPRGWGYDGVNLYAPHEAYGGPVGLKRLVNACHRRGIAVVLDVVYNHLGPEGNYLSRFGPYFTGEYRTPWGDAVNLDGPDSHEVRRFFTDNAVMWLRDYHIDALRIDAVHAFYDRSATHFLEELATRVRTLEAHLGRRLLLIAESDLNDPRIVTSREAGGFGIHAQWSDDFHHSLHAYVSGEDRGYYADFGSIHDIAKALEDSFVYDGRYAPSRRRPHGRSARHLGQERFLGYHQNHDQVGNRAVGERLHHLSDLDRYKISAGLVLLSPFVPMLFQGEEWAASAPFQYFTSHNDPELGEAVSHGRRSEFGDFGWTPEEVPDPQDEATFQRSQLSWEDLKEDLEEEGAGGAAEHEHTPGATAEYAHTLGAGSARGRHAEVLAWYRELVRIRRRYPELAAGAGRPAVIAREGGAEGPSLLMRRGAILIAANFAEESREIRVSAGTLEEILAGSREGASLAAEGRGILMPRCSLVVARLAE